LHTRPDALVADLATRQHGVVARGQLEALGLGRGAIEHRLARGLLHPIHRGVYAVGHRRLTSEGAWMAGVLAAGPGAVLSHRSAAALWGIRNTDRAAVEVIVPRGCRRPGIQPHRATLRPDEIDRERGIPVTNPARTLLDLAEVLTPQQLERAINEAEIRRLASPLPLAAMVARHPTRRGTNALSRILEQRNLGETVTRSALEERFLALVDANGFPRPKMNEPLGPYHPDALWPDERLVVELDSYPIHTTRQAFESDRKRDRELTLAGYRVVRITWRQLRDEPARIADELSALLATPRTPSPRSARRGPRRPRATRATRSGVP
jgi:very-short-patch-repair endonuclease